MVVILRFDCYIKWETPALEIKCEITVVISAVVAIGSGGLGGCIVGEDPSSGLSSLSLSTPNYLLCN